MSYQHPPPPADPDADHIWRVDTPKRTVTFDGYEIKVWAGQRRLLRTTLAELRSIAYRAPARRMPGVLNLNLGRATQAGRIAFAAAERDDVDALVHALRQGGVQLSSKSPKSPTPVWGQVFAGIVVAGVAGFCAYGAISGLVNPAEPRKPDAEEATARCESRVEELLKAPATADFSGVKYLDDNPKWTVSGDVDAENSFGAKLRAGWICKAEVNKAGAWTIDAVLIE